MSVTKTKVKQFPLIHLNGNSGERLTRQYDDAMVICRNLREAMASIEFHPRDYYPLGESAFDTAKKQREEMFDKLNEIEVYLMDHVINILTQTEK